MPACATRRRDPVSDATRPSCLLRNRFGPIPKWLGNGFGSITRIVNVDRVKERKNVLWRRGAGTRNPAVDRDCSQPYRNSKKGRTSIRDPAYLLTTDVTASLKRLVQAYFDRWQIEVNHRDQKSLLGVGQAQVHSLKSVPRHPALSVASYSLLLVAGLQTYGPGRSQALTSLPKWRNQPPHRFSTLDLFTQLRREINETSVFLNYQHKKYRKIS